ncbi:hypothetical protein B6F84_08770 [Acidianus manzaensis]|uniref:Uncharacterized protein n=2 Tax=Acidianus manzaensis TaxID=282676 RepID=A0A1W6K0T4_9CREN|nr:hypothetical protein B6F84_08770 [Acidianus manzaensis]
MMAISEIVKENERLKIELQRYRELAERLEKKIERLEKENKEYKKKYQTLQNIIIRTMQLSEHKETKLREIVEKLRETGEFTR